MAPLTTYHEHTERLLEEINKSKPEVFLAYVNLETLQTGLDPLLEGIKLYVAIEAVGYVAEDEAGRTLQNISDWHHAVASTCSDHYKDLQNPPHDLSVAEAVKDPQLLKLNAIRRGLRLAARRGYVQLQTTRASTSRPFIQSPVFTSGL